LRCSCLEWVLSWCCPTCSRTPTDCMCIYTTTGRSPLSYLYPCCLLSESCFLAKC
jgi:hypothetical protein